MSEVLICRREKGNSYSHPLPILVDMGPGSAQGEPEPSHKALPLKRGEGGLGLPRGLILSIYSLLLCVPFVFLSTVLTSSP